jgi:hypothetical protein
MARSIEGQPRGERIGTADSEIERTVGRLRHLGPRRQQGRPIMRPHPGKPAVKDKQNTRRAAYASDVLYFACGRH